MIDPERHALTVLNRIAENDPEQAFQIELLIDGRWLEDAEQWVDVAIESQGPLAKILAGKIETGASPELAERLWDLCNLLSNRQSIELRPVALAATRRLYETRCTQWFRPTLEQRGELAILLRDQATRLADLGRDEEALALTRKAMGKFLRLAKEDSIFDLELASTLNNLANQLSRLQRREEALAVAIEAAEKFEAIERAQPGKYLALFATALHNLSAKLFLLEHHDKATTVMEWAVERRRELNRLEPSRHLPSLASSLDGLANLYNTTGKLSRARACFDEASALWRDLCGLRPDSYLEDLARTSNNLVPLLLRLGESEEALRAAQEAVHHYKQLTRRQPDRFSTDLARSLYHLARAVAEIGHRSEASGLLLDANRLFEDLATRHPSVFARTAAITRVSLAGALLHESEWDSARQLIEKALPDLERALAAGADSLERFLAEGLILQGTIHEHDGDLESALGVTQRAYGILKGLEDQNPGTVTAPLARCLRLLGRWAARQGHSDQAIEWHDEALGLSQRLTAAAPQEYWTDHVKSLMAMAERYAGIGQDDKALETSRLAVKTAEQFDNGLCSEDLALLAGAYNNLSIRELACENYRPARNALEKAAASFYRLTVLFPHRHLRDRAMTMTNLGGLYFLEDRFEESAAATRESIGLYRSLEEREPGTFVFDLVGALHNLAGAMDQLANGAAALELDLEAVELCRPLSAHSPEGRGYLLLSLHGAGRRLRHLDRAAEGATLLEEALTLAIAHLAKANPRERDLLIRLRSEYLLCTEAASIESMRGLLSRIEELVSTDQDENEKV